MIIGALLQRGRERGNMDNQVHNQIASFIWSIADDCLRDVYVRGKYRDVILPMTVIRRLDALLEDSKEAVLDMKKKLDAAGIDNTEINFPGHHTGDCNQADNRA